VVCVIKVYVKSADGVCFAVAFSGEEILGVTLSSDQKTAVDTIRGSLAAKEPFEVFTQPTQQIGALFAALKEFYDGKTPEYSFILADTDLPIYSQSVLRAVSAIPVGYVASYGAVAKAVGGGARAVGNVMASNLFPLIIPCHRVVKSDFGLGGYGAGGCGIKLELLRREQRGYSEHREINIDKGVLKVFPTETVVKKYC
jgi:methylated-DNA-[protein]-cysteine S-methyltransferase